MRIGNSSDDISSNFLSSIRSNNKQKQFIKYVVVGKCFNRFIQKNDIIQHSFFLILFDELFQVSFVCCYPPHGLKQSRFTIQEKSNHACDNQ